MWPNLQHMNLRAKRREDRGKLAAGRRATNNGNGARQVCHPPDIAMSEGMLSAGEGQPARVAAHRDDDLFRLKRLTIGADDGMRVSEARLAHPRVRGDAHRFEVVMNALLRVDAFYCGAGVCQHAREVNLWRGANQPIVSVL